MTKYVDLINKILKFDNVGRVGIQDDNLIFRDTTHRDCMPTICINLHSFAKECKRYILKKYGLPILSAEYISDEYNKGSILAYSLIDNGDLNTDDEIMFRATTEFDAIIDATIYIIKNGSIVDD
jgi:hypothetical protein